VLEPGDHHRRSHGQWDDARRRRRVDEQHAVFVVVDEEQLRARKQQLLLQHELVQQRQLRGALELHFRSGDVDVRRHLHLRTLRSPA